VLGGRGRTSQCCKPSFCLADKSIVGFYLRRQEATAASSAPATSSCAVVLGGAEQAEVEWWFSWGSCYGCSLFQLLVMVMVGVVRCRGVKGAEY
jgi:hypothetical protein